MTGFKLINGSKKKKNDYTLNFMNMFSSALMEREQEMKNNKPFALETKRKLVLIGVKAINMRKAEAKTHDQLMAVFHTIDYIKSVIAQLTPNEFQTIFPIEKEYKGKRFGIKDYFYTIKYINEIGCNDTIGHNIDEFLWEYQNWELNDFVAEMMCVVSDLRRLEGKKSVMEEFLEEKGVATYTKQTDSQGQEILINNKTGEVNRIKKSKPKHLKLV